MKTDNIVFCCNENYFIPLITVIHSIQENYSKNRRIHFHLIHKENSISEYSLGVLSKLSSSCDNDFTSHILKREFTYRQDIDYISVETFFRYFIPELIEADTVLYLDADIIVRGDISSLFDIPLGNNLIAAAHDRLIERETYMCSVGLPERKNEYFNAGVLLLNCRMMRAQNFTEKLVGTQENLPKKFKYQDQDVLNLTCWPNIHWLNGDYNFASVNFGKIRFLFSNPLIVHWTGGNKPWTPYCERNKYLNEYKKYFKDAVNKIIKL